MKIIVAYALPEKQILLEVTLPDGACVKDAIEASSIRHYCNPAHVGIFGKIVDFDTMLHDGDRVEIYRPLLKDPKEARRAR